MTGEHLGKKKHFASPLRAAAEAQLCNAPAPELPSRSSEELLHELQVHQIELEMQNEELRRAQLVIEESRDRFIDLYDFAPVGYLTLTNNLLIVEANLTAAAMFGVDRRKLLRRRFANLVAPHDSDRLHLSLIKMVQHGAQQTSEMQLARGDGTLFQARLNFRYYDELTFRIALTDISENKRAEAELRIAPITFDAHEGMIITDPNGIILRVNHAFTQLTGYSEQEVIGQTPALLKSGRQDAAFYERMWAVLKQKHYWQGEIWNRRKNGMIYAEWLTISAVITNDGRISHYVGAFSEITKNKEAEAEIHRLAYYDALTKLPNRRLLYDRLNQALAASSRHEHYAAVLFMDLDNFKTLNDTQGHDVGDLLLTEIAQRLQAAVRIGDTIARLGGDEFVVLLEGLSADVREAAVQTLAVGEKIRAHFSHPYQLREQEYHSTASIGISLFHNQDTTIDELLKRADLAMYQAKSAGRNNIRFFDPAMQATLDARSALELDLYQALDRQQFQLHYQPQVNGARRIIGVEALLRWQHPTRGMVSPGDFIPAAEETALILPIGQWVLETACAQIKIWADSPATRDLKLAINVSARQFRQKDFVKKVQLALAVSGADPKCLKIELTESLVLDNVADTVAKMLDLKADGIGFSMDDFGTGYSSLSYLKQLPLDQLKIDQSFVRNLATDPSDAAIVQAIITLGKTFGLHVIAEGVETDAQHGFLDMHGCHAFQGYLFGKPMPIRELDCLLAV
jgi:diguanylate cyclase (GGDEF)-like protein/PAS domain S-box-containing protein